MKRGEKEQKCLDFVKKQIFWRDDTKLKHPFTGKTYDEISDEEFLEEQIWYINNDCCKNYFGLVEKDRKEIEFILRNAKPNNNLNDFPDFVFQGGFIEHFQITSSKITQKGAKHIKMMNDFTRKVNMESEQIKNEWNEVPSFDKIRTKQWEIDNPAHNYEYLVKSFETNWNHHIRSLDKYQGDKSIGIFMVEYPEIALAMYENVYAKWLDGMASGDMREPEEFKCYRLSRDKKMLNFIYDFKDKIKYVIFVYREGVEIIRTENICYIVNLLPWEYWIYPLMVKNAISLCNISVPNSIYEENTDVDEK